MNVKEFKTSRRNALKIISVAIVGLIGFLHARFTRTFTLKKQKIQIPFINKSSKLQIVNEAFIVSDEHGIKVLSRTCPHLGCKVKYDAQHRRFVCPCHGSQFQLTGKYLTGPAKKDLNVLKFKQEKDRLTLFL